jgi:hypothetical protein
VAGASLTIEAISRPGEGGDAGPGRKAGCGDDNARAARSPRKSKQEAPDCGKWSNSGGKSAMPPQHAARWSAV